MYSSTPSLLLSEVSRVLYVYIMYKDLISEDLDLKKELRSRNEDNE